MVQSSVVIRSMLLPDAVHTLFDTVPHSGCGILALRLYRYLILLFRRQPVIFPERIGNIESIQPGTCIEINGEIRTCNKHDSDKNKLLINVYCNEFNIIQEEEFYPSDDIELNGYICKEPVYRKTPLGREIADLLLAVNRKFGKSDYIPCITWSRNARFVNELPVGSNIQVSGRLQSRKYIKRTEDGTEVTKTAYEVSINRIRLIEKASPKENLETPDESCEVQSTPA